MNVFRGRILEASKFAVISDTHLRSLDAQSDDHVSAQDVAELIVGLRQSGDVVIVNGDLFDMDRAALPLGHRQELERLKACNPRHPLWEVLADEGVVLLSGNHDSNVAGLLDSYQAVDIISGGARVRIEHGERFDAWIKRVRPFTSLVTWMSGLTESLSLSRLTNSFRCVEHAMTGSGDEGLFIHLRLLEWLRTHSRYDGIIFGHTHEPAIASGLSGLLANSGQSMRWPVNVIRVDLVGRTVQLQTRGRRGVIERLISKPFAMRLEGCESSSQWRKMASEMGILPQYGE